MARAENPEATEQQITEIAASLKKAHYQRLALKSAAARRAKSEVAKEKKRAEARRQLAQYRPGAAAA